MYADQLSSERTPSSRCWDRGRGRFLNGVSFNIALVRCSVVSLGKGARTSSTLSNGGPR